MVAGMTRRNQTSMNLDTGTVPKEVASVWLSRAMDATERRAHALKHVEDILCSVNAVLDILEAKRDVPRLGTPLGGGENVLSYEDLQVEFQWLHSKSKEKRVPLARALRWIVTAWKQEIETEHIRHSVPVMDEVFQVMAREIQRR